MREVVQLSLDEHELLLLSAMASLGAAIVALVAGHQRLDMNVLSQLVTQLVNSPMLPDWNALQDKIERTIVAAFPDVQVFDLSGTRANSGTRRARGPNPE